ncbi:MAG: ComEA family DNA-binding protein, partial [Gemmatimonadota bacterium]
APPGRAAAGEGIGSRRGSARSGRPPSRIDVNRASARELEALPGIGPALARRIVELRRRKGRLDRAEDLLEVRGIGPATLEELRDRIRF